MTLNRSRWSTLLDGDLFDRSNSMNYSGNGSAEFVDNYLQLMPIAELAGV